MDPPGDRVGDGRPQRSPGRGGRCRSAVVRSSISVLDGFGRNLIRFGRSQFDCSLHFTDPFPERALAAPKRVVGPGAVGWGAIVGGPHEERVLPEVW